MVVGQFAVARTCISHERSSIISGMADINEIAARVVEISTGQPVKREEKNAAAVALGRLGGLKGGKARAAKLTDSQRREIASNAARKRWEEKG
jgi:hypothetical protein